MIALVVALDWGTKAAVALTLPVGGFVEVIPSGLAFWHVRNPEMILGLWGDLALETRWTIALAAILLAPLLIFSLVERGHRLPPAERPWAWLFTGLAFGGFAGNLGERVIRWGVTDFLSLHWGGVWLPPGNVADLAILAAIPLAVPVAFCELRARRRRRTSLPDRMPAAPVAEPDPGPV